MTSKLIFLAIFVILEVSGKLQNITVKGIVMCNGNPKPNARVFLMEKDSLDSDDELAQTWSNLNGEFEIFGEEDEIGKIEPYLRIHHICNNKPFCERISEYKVPQDKIGGTYNMYYLSLNIIVDNDKDNCSEHY